MGINPTGCDLQQAESPSFYSPLSVVVGTFQLKKERTRRTDDFAGLGDQELG